MATELAEQQDREQEQHLAEGEEEGESGAGASGAEQRALQFGAGSGVFTQAPYIEFDNVSVRSEIQGRVQFDG